jgi:hypothetical protein
MEAMYGVVCTRSLWMIAVAAWVVAMWGCATVHKIDGKIGLMDPARVLNDSNAGKKAKDSLAAFSKNRQGDRGERTAPHGGRFHQTGQRSEPGGEKRT